EWIVSTMAAGSPHPDSLIIDDRHVIQFGTSMSAALMTGIAALMLEKTPALTHTQFKEFLKTKSTVPSQPTGTFDPLWGYGLLDMLKL
ncbi:MAG: S8 family serine peptidase, partial [Anaerolineae bacterium]|nr:S8 family serine peptidase [Anaerolineae bacterium]